MSMDLSRRAFLRISVGAIGAASLLGACSQPAPTPTQAPKPAAPAATQAPAAAKPTEAPKPADKPTEAAKPAPTTAPATAAPAAGRITIIQPVDTESFEPNIVRSGVGVNISQQVQEGLIDRARKPLLARSWQNLDDRTWQFELQPNVKFHNGEPFDAAVVKYSIERILDEGNKAVSRGLFLPVVDRVEAVSPTQVKVVTKQPFSALLDILVDAWMIPPVAGAREDYGKTGIGTGPYKLREWTPSERVVLEANPDYWGPQPRIKEVLFRPVAEPSVRMVELRSGGADLITVVPPEMVPDLEGGGLAKLQRRSVQMMRVQLKCDSPPFDDARVRQAVNYAIDKEGILRGILLGAGYVVNGPLGPDLFGHNDTLKPYEYDPERAKALLKEAGAENVEVQFQMPSGRFLKDRAIGEAMVDQLGKVGVKLNANFMEFGTWIQQFNKAGHGFLVLGQDSYPHRLFATTMSGKIKAATWYGYTNPRVDELIDQAVATFDDAKRRDLYRELHQITRDEAPWIYLFNSQDNYGFKDTVKGFDASADGYFYVRDISIG
jgi:peptide/nickel transport system substrate-binding protein